jgi:signal transduction histidine kinase
MIVWRKEEDADVIEVIDYGIGMSPEQLELVNANEAPFSRTGTSGESGTGLGLYISKQLVQSINGTLKIKSELKKGTTVMIRI